MFTERFGSADAIRQLSPSLRRLIQYEHFNLHRLDVFHKDISDSGFDLRYLPQNCEAFPIPCFWIRRRHLYVYGRQSCGTEMQLFDGVGESERVLLPVHPTSLVHSQQFLLDVGADDAAKEGLRVWATPTSSTRTLLVWPDGAPDKAVFVKTSLHAPVLGGRHLSLTKVGCSVGLSMLVRESQAQLPDFLGYCWERVGYVPRCMTDSGVIVRSIPAEMKDDRMLVAPLFALMGGSSASPPIFLTMLERDGIAAREFLANILCGLFARLWLAMSMLHGLILEAHGQDLMVVLSADHLTFKRFIYRDFEGLQVDWSLRQGRRSPDTAALPHAWAWYETYASWGYRYGGLAFYKLITSLDQYLHFVMGEFDRALRAWQEQGLITGPRFARDQVSVLFSSEMTKAMEELFGVRLDARDSLYRSSKRFVMCLMKIRRELIHSENQHRCRPKASHVQ
jgi:hypothetical protein